MGVLVRFFDGRTITQKAIGYKHSDVSLDQFTLAGLLRKTLASISLEDARCISITHDEAAVNLAAIDNLQRCTFFPKAIEVMCWPHLLNRAGRQLSTPVLQSFLELWQTAVGQTPTRRRQFKLQAKTSCLFISNFTRWHSSYEVGTTPCCYLFLTP